MNLCIANCYNKLKDYDDAAAVLSETAHNWPFDIVVKVNQAVETAFSQTSTIATELTDEQRKCQGHQQSLQPLSSLEKKH